MNLHLSPFLLTISLHGVAGQMMYAESDTLIVCWTRQRELVVFFPSSVYV